MNRRTCAGLGALLWPSDEHVARRRPQSRNAREAGRHGLAFARSSAAAIGRSVGQGRADLDLVSGVGEHVVDQRGDVGIVLDEDDPPRHPVGLSWSKALAMFSRTSALTCSDSEYTTNCPRRSAVTAA